MSALMQQHERWEVARSRLWGTPPPVVRQPPPRPVSPFAAVPRWEKLFTKPIEALDEHGNVVVAGTYMPQWRRIALEVCSKHQIQLNELISPRRSREVVRARHECFWRLKKETSLSFPQIGRYFGGRDHTTVLHGIRAHEKRMEAGNA